MQEWSNFQFLLLSIGESRNSLFEGIEGYVPVPEIIRIPAARGTMARQRVIGETGGRGIHAITRKSPIRIITPKESF